MGFNMKLIVLVILGFSCLLNGKKIDGDDAEQLSEPELGSDSFESDADLIDQETKAELNAMEDDGEHDPEGAIEKQDPFIITGTLKAISFYCRYCKRAKMCQRLSRRCTSSVLRKSQQLCKYCSPSYYYNVLRRFRWGARRRRGRW